MRTAFDGAVALRRSSPRAARQDPLATGAMARPGAPGTAPPRAHVAEWWSTLTAAEKEAVVAAYPDVIGCADGLPADARDQANRILLAGDLALLGAKEDDGTLSVTGGARRWTTPGPPTRRCAPPRGTSTRRAASSPAASCGSTTRPRSTATGGSRWRSATWTPPTTWRCGCPASPTTAGTRRS